MNDLSPLSIEQSHPRHLVLHLPLVKMIGDNVTAESGRAI